MRIQEAQAQFARHEAVLRRVLAATFSDPDEASRFDRFLRGRLDSAAAEWETCEAREVLDLVRESLVDYLSGARFEQTVFGRGGAALKSAGLVDPTVRLVMELLLIDGLPASQWARSLRVSPGAVSLWLLGQVGEGSHTSCGSSPLLRQLIDTGHAQAGTCPACIAQAQALAALRERIVAADVHRVQIGSSEARGEPTQPITILRQSTGRVGTAGTTLGTGAPMPAARSMASRLNGSRPRPPSARPEAVRWELTVSRGTLLSVAIPLLLVAVLPAARLLVAQASVRPVPVAPAVAAREIATAPETSNSGMTVQVDHEPAHALAEGAQVVTPVQAIAHVVVESGVDVWLEGGSRARIFHDRLVLGLGTARVLVGVMSAGYLAEVDALHMNLTAGLYVLRHLAGQRPGILVVRGHAAATNADAKGVEAWTGGKLIAMGGRPVAVDAPSTELTREQATAGALGIDSNSAQDDVADSTSTSAVEPADSTSWQAWANQMARSGQGGSGSHMGMATTGDYRAAF